MDIGLNRRNWQGRIRQRSEKQAERFRRRYQRERRLYHAIKEDAADILHSSNFRRTRQHVQIHNLHGFYHPGIALKNASAEYQLTPREKDIIKKHMWPLTVVPPMCREAWIVTLADKWCSTLETLHLHHGHGAVKYLTVNDEEN